MNGYMVAVPAETAPSNDVQVVVQQPDYNVTGVNVFQESLAAATSLLAHKLLPDFVPAVLAEAELFEGKSDLSIYTLLLEGNLEQWNQACADFIATTLPVKANLSKDVVFLALINAYQGKYMLPYLVGEGCKPRRIKQARRVGSEQLLRRLFSVDGNVLYNPFGGFFLQKIQDIPLVLKFWLVLHNIAEVAPRMKLGEDVSINYFARLFPVKSPDGRNLYDALQDASK